ncbi:MAG TPA: radical SAM family heme chaperone HemW [Mycobacteriales bacterium]|nr:radical SAM family heme chaperone HemW [Mycobacteriales bacterium]
MPSRLPDGVPAPADGALPPAAVRELGRNPFGFYVHVPFCATRCGYCDFTTYTAQELGPGVSQAAYADTAMLELRLARHVLGDRTPQVETVFFGGGTPTLLPAGHLGSILREIDDLFGLAPGAEVTTEANPESVTPAYLARLREAGFTRISFGMQSAAQHVLQVLDRRHTPGRAVEVVAEARRAGFSHVNLDLIYGTPGESEADWQASLDAAVGAGPDHVSAYALVVEEGTAMARKVSRGELPEPDDDVLADRYVQADETLSRNGFGWYEVSNWARGTAARSRHNRLYWTGGDWWGVGPGAHSHVGGVRWWNVRHPAAYAARLHAGESPAAGRELLDPPARRMETTMLGLRLREGLAVRELTERARVAAGEAVGYGLLDRHAHGDGRAVLTLRGRLLADAVARDLTD